MDVRAKTQRIRQLPDRSPVLAFSHFIGDSTLPVERKTREKRQ